ncbi:unnamed protein product [Gordionus sp. m RMFG-2023]
MSNIKFNKGLNFEQDISAEALPTGLNAEQESHFAMLGRFAKSAWLKNQFTDITVKIGDKNIRAHSVVLGAHSVFFDDYFSQMYDRPNMRHVPEVTLPTDVITVPIFQKILEYMYTAEFTGTVEEVKEIHKASEVLKVDNLTELCKQFLMEKTGELVQ